MKLKKVLFAVLTFAFVLLTFSGFKSIAADKTATYTVTSTSAVTTENAPDGTSETYSSTYSGKCQLTSGNSMTLTLSGYAGYKVTGLTLSMKSNTSKGAGSLSAVAGTRTLASIKDSKFNTSNWNGAWSTKYVNITPDFTSYVVGTGENIVITIAATENSLYCESFTITYDEATLSDYVTTSSTKSSLRVDYDKEVVSINDYTYSLVTDVTSLADGDKLVIAAKDYDVALGSTQNDNNRAEAAVTKLNEGASINFNDNSGVQILTLVASDTNFKFYTGKGYLYASSSSSNHLKTTTSTSNANSIFSITLADETGVATITAQGTNTINTIKYNSSSDLFSCYAADNTNQDDIVIYKEASVGTTEVNSYTFTTVKIRFGGVITTSLYNELVAESATFGIELSTNSNFSSSETKTYTMTPAVNGDNYQWAAVVTTPVDKYATTIYARAYVVISGTTYYMNATNYSVNSIAQYYVDNAATLGITDTGMLSALAEA
ncbi:MAG: hypothetical protein K6A63_08505 [Acholeplasmatales bacterium]|nr:hypothetical protein [Acholeplasmatales bacterium]